MFELKKKFINSCKIKFTFAYNKCDNFFQYYPPIALCKTQTLPII